MKGGIVLEDLDLLTGGEGMSDSQRVLISAALVPLLGTPSGDVVSGYG
jgi:hypothetical protein